MIDNYFMPDPYIIFTNQKTFNQTRLILTLSVSSTGDRILFIGDDRRSDTAFLLFG